MTQDTGMEEVLRRIAESKGDGEEVMPAMIEWAEQQVGRSLTSSELFRVAGVLLSWSQGLLRAGRDRLQWVVQQCEQGTVPELPTFSEPDGVEGRDHEVEEPAPPGTEDPIDALNGLFAAVILNEKVRRRLVKEGVLSKPQVRALIWLRTGRDIGLAW